MFAKFSNGYVVEISNAIEGRNAMSEHVLSLSCNYALDVDAVTDSIVDGLDEITLEPTGVKLSGFTSIVVIQNVISEDKVQGNIRLVKPNQE